MAGSADPNGLDAPDPGALGAKPPAEDPRALALRLAAEAKAKREAAKAAEDPRELARRLASEAKAKREARSNAEGLASTAPPPGRVVAELPNSDAPASKKKKKCKAKPAGLAAAAPPPQASTAAQSSLADRAAASRPMSAQEALAAALAAESSQSPTAEAKQAQAKKKKKKKKRKTEEASEAVAATQPAASAPQPLVASHDPGGVVIGVFPTGEVRKATPVLNADVFKALWNAHRVRALHEEDLALVSAACVLLDAVDRLPPGGLCAVRARVGDRDHAIWVDTCRGSLLAITSPPEIYLAGL